MTTTITTIRQTPDQEGNWLYFDQPEQGRIFSQEVYLPSNGQLWTECTQAEREQWEQEHPQPEPEPTE